MKLNEKYRIVVVLVVAMGLMTLSLNLSIGAGATKFTQDLRGEIVQLPSSAPEREKLVLVSFVHVIAESKVVGAVALYDDANTKAATDYMEIYDGTGSLVSVSWLDPSGIRRTAMDSGLLEDEDSKPQGLLVLLTEGTQL